MTEPERHASLIELRAVLSYQGAERERRLLLARTAVLATFLVFQHDKFPELAGLMPMVSGELQQRANKLARETHALSEQNFLLNRWVLIAALVTLAATIVLGLLGLGLWK